MPSLIPGGICHALSTRRDRAHQLIAEFKEGFRLHRKLWEYTLVAEALEQMDLLRPGMRGLGFGVGNEPLVAWCAARGCEIVATDFAQGWYPDFAVNDRAICQPDDFARLVSKQIVDMNWIPDEFSGGFDFCWSCCSMDHLGSIRLGKRFVYNSLKCLKPGGVAIHTGEYNMQSDWDTLDYQHTVLWTNLDVEEVLAWARDHGCTTSFDWTTGGEAEDQINGQNGDTIHLRLWINRFIATSFGVVIQKVPQ